MGGGEVPTHCPQAAGAGPLGAQGWMALGTTLGKNTAPKTDHTRPVEHMLHTPPGPQRGGRRASGLPGTRSS